jgi:mycothiol synthase
MKVRPCRATDFADVLALITDAAVADGTPRMTAPILRQVLWKAPEARSVAESVLVTDQGDAPLGFGWWTVGGSRGQTIRFEGWVHPRHRRRGVGTALLVAAEAYARDHIGGGARIAARGYADIPGLLPLFQMRGFDMIRRFYRMGMPLGEGGLRADVPPGVTLDRFRPEDLEALVDADNAIFADHWGALPRTVAAWRHEMIETRPHDPALWIIARSADGLIVAECLCHASRDGAPDDGWISIVGVRREWRGRGLGQAVLCEGLDALRAAGFRTVGLHVDAENTAAIGLYRGVGMALVRQRLHFMKVLDG